MDREKSGAGGKSKQDKTDADDKIDEAGADVEEPVAMVDGEDAPFGDDDENEADDAVAGQESGADGADRKQEVEKNMNKGAQRIAAFADKNIICHIFIITKLVLQ